MKLVFAELKYLYAVKKADKISFRGSIGTRGERLKDQNETEEIDTAITELVLACPGRW